MPYSDYQVATSKAQAQELRAQARKGGLRFDAYLPSNLADWMLDMVERGIFISPSEAVFTILSEHKELQPHADLREELFRRRIRAALDDKGPTFTIDEVIEHIEQRFAQNKPAVIWSDDSLKSQD